MRKKIGPPLPVARIAAGISFFALTCSILFSNIIQIQDRLDLFVFIREKIFENTIVNAYYEETKIFFIETLNQNLKEKFSCPSYLLPGILFIVSIFTQFGLIKGKLEKNIKELYKPLKEKNYKFEYRLNVIFFVLNVAAFSFWWIRLDFPAMLFSFVGCVLQYFIGLYFNYKFNVWSVKCFGNK